MTNTTHFGFKQVGEEEKSTLVRGVFNSVASRYDLMNDLMSAGLHRLWKREMVSWLNPSPQMRVLDVAGGTGDIAFRIQDRMFLASSAKQGQSPTQPSPARGEGNIIIADINRQMLGEGRNRALDQNRTAQLEWVCADAEALPFTDQYFDAYTIAFGIRNVTHIDRALSEAFRVLKPGGRFLCLEFSAVNNEALAKLYGAYSFSIIPKVGKWVTGDEDAYRYLVESIRRFPNQQAFADMIRQAGFGNVQFRTMTAGVVALHSARKL